MKLLILNGTPKTDGLCHSFVKASEEAAVSCGIKTETVQLSSLNLTKCKMCGNGWGICFSEHKCAFGDGDGRRRRFGGRYRFGHGGGLDNRRGFDDRRGFHRKGEFRHRGGLHGGRRGGFHRRRDRSSRVFPLRFHRGRFHRGGRRVVRGLNPGGGPHFRDQRFGGDFRFLLAPPCCRGTRGLRSRCFFHTLGHGLSVLRFWRVFRAFGMPPSAHRLS